jgi:hypothetical protein
LRPRKVRISKWLAVRKHDYRKKHFAPGSRPILSLVYKSQALPRIAPLAVSRFNNDPSSCQNVGKDVGTTGITQK